RRARRALVRSAQRAIRRRRFAQARRSLTAALKLSDGYRLRELMALTHQLSRELWPATHHLKKAATLAPARSQGRLHYKLAMIYFLLKKQSLGCAALRRAAKSKPPYKRAYAGLRRCR
ncbi:MAG: hypothetical protein KC503_34320, partial [Myxococcales bacterium]|nr:hypothetical protein [Myxococcales bacterium]